MKKKILITGVAGMIGSELLSKKLLHKKDSIYGIDNFNGGKKENIINYKKKNNFKFIYADISKKKSINFNNKLKFDEIWLLAANSDIKKGIKNTNIDFKNTFLTTYNFLNSIKNNLKNYQTKIIFTSSSAIFGSKKKKIKFNLGPLSPISNYGAMKAASESYVYFFCNLYNCKPYIFRLPNVISENYTHGIINDFIKKIKSKSKKFQVLGNGFQKKPYVHAEELINIIEKIINKKSNINHFNLGPNDDGINVKYIANKIKKTFQSKKKIFYEKQKEGWFGDVTKFSYENSWQKKNRLNFKLSSKECVDYVIKKIKVNDKN